MGNFRKLNVWKDAMIVVVEVYNLTKEKDFSRDFGLKDQIQRSAVSIPSNIAEGEESLTQKLAIRYFSIAKASAAELITQLIIASEINYIKKEQRILIENKVNKISASLNSLIQYRHSLANKNPNP